MGIKGTYGKISIIAGVFVVLVSVLAFLGFGLQGKILNINFSAESADATDSYTEGKIAMVRENTKLFVRWPATEKERLVVEALPNEVSTTREFIVKPLFSPDGKHLAFVRTIERYDGYLTGQEGTLWIATGNGHDPRPLSEQVVLSHWDNDSKWLYCYRYNNGPAGSHESTVWQKVNVENGQVEILTDSSKELDDEWLSSVVSPKGQKLTVEKVMDAMFGLQTEDFKLVISDSKGTRTITGGSDILGKTEGRPKTLPPAWSPNGRYAAMTIYANVVDGWEEMRQWEQSTLYIYDTELDKGFVVPSQDVFICWAPDSSGLVVSNGGDCGVIKLDGKDFRSVGPNANEAHWVATEN